MATKLPWCSTRHMALVITPPPSTDARRARGDVGSFVALMYHNLCADERAYRDLSPSITSYFVTRAAFAEQMRELPSCGGHCMRWEALEDFYRPRGATSSVARRRPGYPVLLTFDDGWREAVEVGGPLLQQHRCQAIVFVTTDFLGRPNFLSRRDLWRLDPNVFRVGSHARTHRMLSLLGESDIRAELSDSKKHLEDATGRATDALSIPSGAVDRRVRRIAAECGYRFVCDSRVRANRRGGSPTAIGRVALTRNTPIHAFRRYVQQRIVRERLRGAALLAPKWLLGLQRYEKFRRRLLGEQPGQTVTHES